MKRTVLIVVIFLFAPRLSATDGSQKNFVALMRALYEISPLDRAKAVEVALQQPLDISARFPSILASLDQPNPSSVKKEIRRYITHIADYYRAQAQAIANAPKDNLAVTDRLLHLMLDDYADALAQALSEFHAPAYHLNVGTVALLKRYTIALERFMDRRVELFSEGEKKFNPSADDHLVDNLHYVLLLLQIPYSPTDKAAFTDRDARTVRYFKEATHLMAREANMGIDSPLAVTLQY